jgi:glycosyltransferase involved in cell wall biosynthesis
LRTFYLPRAAGSRPPMSRPRILYVLGSLAANDLGDEVVTILGRLAQSRFDPAVVNLGGREDLRPRVEAMKVPTHSLGLVGPLGALRAVPKVRGLIREIGAEVVHGYGSWGGAVAQLAAPQDVPVVRTVSRPPTSEKDLRGRFLRHLERRARSRGATRFVVPNEGSIGLALRAYGAAESHVAVLPRSVDVGRVRDGMPRTAGEQARVLMGIGQQETAAVLLTNFESGARMDEVLTGFALASRRDESLRLFVVGSGRYEGPTRWKAEELQLEAPIVFLGRGSEDLPIWAAADLAIDATPWASWSRAALVAIAARVPTVKLQAGVDGWSEDLSERLPMLQGRPDRLAADLVRLSSDPAVRDEIRAACAEVVDEDEVDVVNVVNRLGDLYRSLMN